jgi:serine protease AprX
MAVVRGTVTQLAAAVRGGVVRDVYPNDRLEYLSTASRHTTRVDRVPGLSGKGVTVAIVDSGIDATNPDLAHRVVRNYKVVGPEYANLPPGAGPGSYAIPFQDLPYNDTDLVMGHGTHVAGIVAADGSSNPALTGMAPGAHLVGLSTGEVLLIITALAAFDQILDHPEWGVRVVNNSWGTSHQTFDPDHPVNIATRALHDRGIVVVFSAGNDGTDHTQMTMNPYSVAPWVISVAAGTVDDPATAKDEDKMRASFSSVGLDADDSQAAPLRPSGHVRFTGNRVGLYHPDLTAPGENILSTATPAGVLVMANPTSPREATASGTSMASPHVAGAAAVLLQAMPKLSPDDIAKVLQVTATPLADHSPFVEAGYGHIDLAAAVALVQRRDFSRKLLDRLQAEADARVLASTPLAVTSGDYWSWPAADVTIGGVPDRKIFTARVPKGTKRVRAWSAYPSSAYLGLSIADYAITVRDAAGKVVGTSTASPVAGASSLTVDISKLAGVRFGAWQVQVDGTGVSDPHRLETYSVLGLTVSAAFVVQA